MKKLSRNEMKNVMGGESLKILWNCLVQDGTPGGAYYQICAFTNPEALCQYDPESCYETGTCNSNTLCVN